MIGSFKKLYRIVRQHGVVASALRAFRALIYAKELQYLLTKVRATG